MRAHHARLDAGVAGGIAAGQALCADDLAADLTVGGDADCLSADDLAGCLPAAADGGTWTDFLRVDIRCCRRGAGIEIVDVDRVGCDSERQDKEHQSSG